MYQLVFMLVDFSWFDMLQNTALIHIIIFPWFFACEQAANYIPFQLG